jgi:phage I-like protein
MANKTASPRTAVAALTVEVKAGQREYLLIPDGVFRASDGSGRPDGVPAWRLTPAAAADVLRRAQSRTAKMVVDYEHQTLNKTENGQPAPAAGRIDRASLRYQPGVGILGAIDWTPRAAEMIAAGEYAYLSPVFLWHPETGEVLALHSVALTNDPGLDLPSVAALTALTDFSTEEESHVNETLKNLLAALGLADTTSEADALSAVAALKAKAEQVDGLQGQVAALSAQKPDPSKFVAVETMQALQNQVAALTAQVTGDKVTQLVESALTAGKLLPPQKDWALDLGKSNLAALNAYLEKTPAIVALNGTQTDGRPPVGADGKLAALTATEAAVAAQLGVSVDDFAKGKAAA